MAREKRKDEWREEKKMCGNDVVNRENKGAQMSGQPWQRMYGWLENIPRALSSSLFEF